MYVYACTQKVKAEKMGVNIGETISWQEKEKKGGEGSQM